MEVKMKLRNFCINEKETIIAAVEAIENNHQRNVFIVNGDDKVIGILSQGDIIRSIITGTSLYTQSGKICNTSFIYLNEKDMERAYEIFKSINISILPVLDEHFHLIDIIDMKSMYDFLESKAKI